MRFKLDNEFRTKISVLAKTAERMNLQIDEVDVGQFRVVNGKRIYYVTAAVDREKMKLTLAATVRRLKILQNPVSILLGF
jgi:hypothetical protein